MIQCSDLPLCFVGQLVPTSGIVDIAIAIVVATAEAGNAPDKIGAKAWDSDGTGIAATDGDDALTKGSCNLEHRPTVGKNANDEDDENIPESLHECLDAKEVKPMI